MALAAAACLPQGRAAALGLVDANPRAIPWRTAGGELRGPSAWVRLFIESHHPLAQD